MALRGGQIETVAIPKRIQLAAQPENRSADLSKDPQLINCFVERGTNDDEHWVVKRPGISNRLYDSGTSGNGRGVAYFEPEVTVPKLISIVGTNVFSHNLVTFAATLIGATALTPSNMNFFTIMTNNAGQQKLLFSDGTTAYFTDGVTVTQLLAINGFPPATLNSFRRGLVYLDGTLYVFASPNEIRGTTALDDPVNWDPLNSIRARTEGDFGVGLAKHLQYVVALKQWTTDFFYNAGNPTGSPLSLLRGATLPYGCYDSGTIQDIEGSLVWVSSNRSTGPQVSMLTKMQHQIISTPAVERILRNLPGGNTGGTPRGWTSQTIRMNGHTFYIVTFPFFLPTNNPITLVYDLTSRLWYRWASPDGNAWLPRSVTYLPEANAPWRCIAQDIDGHLYEIAEDYTYPTDVGQLFPVDIYTPDHDFGTQRTKELGAMFFKGDIVPGSSLQMRWSDDNYQTWSNFREFNLGIQRPNVVDCGSFFRRAWNFRHQAATPFRLKTSDLQLDIGIN